MPERRTLTYLLLLWSLAVLSAPVRADAWLIDVEGPIGPAVADHMIRGLDQAGSAGAELVILRIDTPGGLDSSMRDMIKAILASPLPVLGYVSPSGARAASNSAMACRSRAAGVLDRCMGGARPSRRLTTWRKCSPSIVLWFCPGAGPRRRSGRGDDKRGL